MRAMLGATAGQLAATALIVLASSSAHAGSPYAWNRAAPAHANTLAGRIAPPRGYEREPATEGSFAAWLRGLPLKPAGSPVMLHSGAPKWRQNIHAAVIDIDTGRRDLQQCADAVMRLRAEWLYGIGRARDIAFDFTDGTRVPFARWAKGERPHPVGNRTRWTLNSAPDAAYASFRAYMTTIFVYAGTFSLQRELTRVSLADIAIGDVFIKGGFPGHAVLVVDVARNRDSGEARVLLAQSFMPAQDIHVLRNPASAEGSPWYGLDFGARLVTPEWVFARDSLRRFPAP